MANTQIPLLPSRYRFLPQASERSFREFHIKLWILLLIVTALLLCGLVHMFKGLSSQDLNGILIVAILTSTFATPQVVDMMWEEAREKLRNLEDENQKLSALVSNHAALESRITELVEDHFEMRRLRVKLNEELDENMWLTYELAEAEAELVKAKNDLSRASAESANILALSGTSQTELKGLTERNARLAKRLDEQSEELSAAKEQMDRYDWDMGVFVDEYLKIDKEVSELQLQLDHYRDRAERYESLHQSILDGEWTSSKDREGWETRTISLERRKT